MSSNLPPGVRDCDLPGNTPDDEEFDRFLDTEECAALGEEVTAEELSAAFERWRRSRREAADTAAFERWIDRREL